MRLSAGVALYNWGYAELVRRSPRAQFLNVAPSTSSNGAPKMTHACVAATLILNQFEGGAADSLWSTHECYIQICVRDYAHHVQRTHFATHAKSVFVGRSSSEGFPAHPCLLVDISFPRRVQPRSRRSDLSLDGLRTAPLRD